MITRSFLLASVFVLAVLGCEPTKEQPEMAVASVDDAALLEDAIHGIAAHWNAGDLEGALAFFADEFMQMPPDASARVGLNVNEQNWHGFLSENANQWDPVVTEVQVVGDLGYVRGTSTETTTPLAGGDTTITDSDGLWIFERQPDGSWKEIFEFWIPKPGD